MLHKQKTQLSCKKYVSLTAEKCGLVTRESRQNCSHRASDRKDHVDSQNCDHEETQEAHPECLKSLIGVKV